jgi:hypothetical protein
VNEKELKHWIKSLLSIKKIEKIEKDVEKKAKSGWKFLFDNTSCNICANNRKEKK